MRAQKHAPGSRFPFPVPRVDVAHLIHRDIVQANTAEELDDLGRTGGFGTGWCRDRGQLSLTRQRDFVGALDVGAGGADAIVGEQRVDHTRKL